MKNLIKPENEAEARALQSLLHDHGIPSQVISFHDTAYNGLYQSQYGWGVIRVDESDFAEAVEIVQEWKESTPVDFSWSDGQKDLDESN